MMSKLSVVLVFVFLAFNYITADLPEFSGNGETIEHWNDLAKKELKKAKNLKPTIAVAKNVIVFLGDGMGVSTVTAARILKGQLKGATGEEGHLSFESFPHLGLSKTYNQDAQTADSAGTATAYFSGVKTNLGVIGVDARSRRKICSTSDGTHLNSILDWSKDAGKSVGIVTTTRITHATPSALYAHSADRDWEGDSDMENITGGCKDIASQLVDDNIDINVLLGGGRNRFLKNTDIDPESGSINSKYGRMDGRNLIEDWKQKQFDKKGRTYQYVWNLTSFNAVKAEDTDYLLGLFGSSHMQYEIDRATDQGGEPSLAEMTDKAIKILSKNPKGFFLMVEGGRIDHGHHDSKAKKALYDTLAFDDAVAKGVSMTSSSDTLIVTTADHSHVFTIGGYPTRGNPIFGLVDDRNGSYKKAQDGNGFTTLSYANGPGGYVKTADALRPHPENTNDTDYIQQSGVPLEWETHGGEEVAIYASGPMAHLFHGVHEQHYIAHVLAYASCVGGYSSHDSCAMSDVNAMNTNTAPGLMFNVYYCLIVFSVLVLAS